MIVDRTASIDGVELHFAEAESPYPPIVLLHGLTDSLDAFLSIMPRIQEVAHVYAVDLRGHGDSAHVPNSYRVRDYAHDIEVFLTQVVREPAILVGNSLGSLVVSYLAARTPTRIRGVLLGDPPLYTGQMPTIRGMDIYESFIELREELLAHHRAGGAPDDLLQDVDNPEYGEDLRKIVAKNFHRLDPTTLSAFIEGYAFDGFDPDTDLPRMTCPVHLIVARGFSNIMRDEDLERVQRLIKQFSYVIFGNTMHGLHRHRPEKYAEEVCAFIDRL